jgi:hypothetical protein
MNAHPGNVDAICFYCQDGYISVEGQCQLEKDPYKDTKAAVGELYPGCALIRDGKCQNCKWSEGYFMTRPGLCEESPNWQGNEDRELLGLGIEVNLYKDQNEDVPEEDL